jgi:hypothetical protein
MVVDRGLLPAYHAKVPNLTRAWTTAEAALPLKWRIKGLVEGPHEVSPVIRSQDWVAYARGPDRQHVQGQGGNARGRLG